MFSTLLESPSLLCSSRVYAVKVKVRSGLVASIFSFVQKTFRLFSIRPNLKSQERSQLLRIGEGGSKLGIRNDR
jgi:hypothetical protein